MPTASDVTHLLRAASDGVAHAADELLPMVYDELRRLAARSLRRERSDHTLEPTALVHEAYLRLVSGKGIDWKGRTHFYALSAQAIRRILVDHARGRRSEKHGGLHQRVPIEGAQLVADGRNLDLIALDEAMGKLSQEAPRKARIVELRFFGGLTIAESAELLGVSTRSVERDWQFARAWLYRELDDHKTV